MHALTHRYVQQNDVTSITDSRRNRNEQYKGGCQLLRLSSVQLVFVWQTTLACSQLFSGRSPEQVRSPVPLSVSLRSVEQASVTRS